jgi:hypothetical protein
MTMPEQTVSDNPEIEWRSVFDYVWLRWGSTQPWDERDRKVVDRLIASHRSESEMKMREALVNLLPLVDYDPYGCTVCHARLAVDDSEHPERLVHEPTCALLAARRALEETKP